jgi:hypothetical protein
MSRTIAFSKEWNEKPAKINFQPVRLPEVSVPITVLQVHPIDVSKP